jgi:hypothetical protein
MAQQANDGGKDARDVGGFREDVHEAADLMEGFRGFRCLQHSGEASGDLDFSRRCDADGGARQVQSALFTQPWDSEKPHEEAAFGNQGKEVTSTWSFGVDREYPRCLSNEGCFIVIQKMTQEPFGADGICAEVADE